jgi:nucleoside-diphosphate-sugar epimerase
MRVFLTGAAGFIGTVTTKELIANGHQVLGLARSDDNAKALEKLGAQVHRGSLEDLDSLRKGAKETEGTIHLAFIHDFSKFAENGQIDKRAIDAMGDALAGSGKPFIVTSGTLLVAPTQKSQARKRWMADHLQLRGAVTLDEGWQAEQWGSDAEAEAALANKRRDFMAAARFLELLG